MVCSIPSNRRRQGLRRQSGPRSASGFTLLELIIILGIVGILAAMVGPGLQSAMKASNISSTRDALASAIRMARATAIYQKVPATICASTDQASCSGGSDWEQGWIIFSDDNGDGGFDGAPEVLIDTNDGGTNIRVGADGTGGIITFQANGIRTVAGTQVIGICDEDTGSTLQGSAMQISTVGGIRYQGNPGC